MDVRLYVTWIVRSQAPTGGSRSPPRFASPCSTDGEAAGALTLNPISGPSESKEIRNFAR